MEMCESPSKIPKRQSENSEKYLFCEKYLQNVFYFQRLKKKNFLISNDLVPRKKETIRKNANDLLTYLHIFFLKNKIKLRNQVFSGITDTYRKLYQPKKASPYL